MGELTAEVKNLDDIEAEPSEAPSTLTEALQVINSGGDLCAACSDEESEGVHCEFCEGLEDALIDLNEAI